MIEDHYSRCKLATFKIGKDCQCLYFILSIENISFHIMKRHFCCQFDYTIEIYVLLGIAIMWSLLSKSMNMGHVLGFVNIKTLHTTLKRCKYIQ